MNIPQLDTVAIGWPITRMGVSFFPLYLAATDLPAILTGEASDLAIDELDEPSVQALRVRNPGDKPVLVVDGEHIVGGDQNRTINVTVLVAALADQEIPISCLESGRWGRRRTARRDVAHTAARVRAAKNVGVAASMRRNRSREGNQSAVWNEVDAMLSRAGMESSTRAAADVRGSAYNRKPSRAAAIEELAAGGPLPGQCGIVVVHGRWVTAMDLFGAPHLLDAHWSGLIRSHLLEPSIPGGKPSATRVLQIVRRFATGLAEDDAGVGLGVEYRMADDRIIGHALTLDGAIVHAAFFARSPQEQAHAGCDLEA